MIDPRLLRESPDDLRESQRRRGEDVALVDRLIELDGERRSRQAAYDEIRAEQKQLSKRIGPLQGAVKKGDTSVQPELDTLMAAASELAERVKAADAAAGEATRALDEAWMALSNLVDMRARRRRGGLRRPGDRRHAAGFRGGGVRASRPSRTG